MALDILFALSITLLIEPIIISALKRFDMKLFITSFGLNIVLNISMNFLLLVLNRDHYYVYLTIFEIATVVIETLIIFMINKTDLSRTALFTLLANLASFLMGYILNKAIISNQILELILTIVFFTFSLCLLGFTIVLFALVKENNKNNDATDEKADGNGEDKDAQ